MRSSFVATALALSLAIGCAASVHADDASRLPIARPTSQYGALPLLFEPIVSTADGRRGFVARGANYAIGVTVDGARLAFASRSGPATAMGIRFVGANPDARVAGIEPQPTRIHHIGHPTNAVALGSPAFGRVAIAGAYPGIDVVFHGRGRDLEYDVIVAPGVDPSRFAFRIEGTAASLNEAGDLTLGPSTLRRPFAFQDIDGQRLIVASEFTIDDDEIIRFRVGEYDPARTLVIDPVVSYATYLGGSGGEQGTAIAVDGAGNAYITGYTVSSDFPLLNPLDSSFGRRGDTEVFVSKLNQAGNALVWSTYIGGSTGVDRAVGIAVDASGSVYVTGQTSSNDFPVTATAWQKGIAGGGGFVAKLTPAGNALAYSTYVAGANPSGIAVDPAGIAHVSGSATSAFVTTPNALQPLYPGPITGFVLAVNSSGSAPIFATFLGGNGGEDATSIGVDTRGNTYVAGWTRSTDFPLRGAIQTAPAGGKDAFVAKIDPTGSQLLYATRLGGAFDDSANAIAVDATGSAYIAGETYSWDFPVKDGFQMQKAGKNIINSSTGSAFVAKLSPLGNALVYSSYLGGETCKTTCWFSNPPPPQSPGDAAYGIAVDASGHAYVAGLARSYTFPQIDSAPRQKQNDNEQSAFVTKVGISGGTLLWSTWVNTTLAYEVLPVTRFPPYAAHGVAIDSAGAAYVTGDIAGGTDVTFQPTPGAFQTVLTGSPALVMKFAAAPEMALTTSNATADAQTQITLSATLSGPFVAGTVAFLDGMTTIGSAALTANQATLTLALPAGIHPLTALLRIPGLPTDTPIVQQVIDVPLVCN